MKDYKVKNKSKAVTKKSYKKNMYAFGGTVQDKLNDYLQLQTSRNKNENLIQTPDAALVENNIAQAKAQLAANTNGFVQGTQLLGQAGLQIGGGMMSDALDKDPSAATVGKDKDGKGGVNLAGLTKLTSLGGLFAMGGTVMPQQGQNVPIEAEGGEMVKLPGDATATEVNGASHENGGVDMNLPEGTQIFSKRLNKETIKETNKLDKSYAEREKARTNYIKRLQAQLDKDPTNQTVRKTLEKVSNDAQMVSEKDIAEMEAKKLQMQYADNPDAMNLDKSANSINEAMASSKEKFAFGGRINPPKKKFFSTNYDDPNNPVIETSFKEKYAYGGTIDPPFKKFRTNFTNLDSLYNLVQPEQNKYSMQKKLAQEGIDNGDLENQYIQENNKQRFNPVYSVNSNSYEDIGEKEPNQRFIPNIMKLGTGPESYYDVGKEKQTKFSWENSMQNPIDDNKIIGDGKNNGTLETSNTFNDPKRKVDNENFSNSKPISTKGLQVVGDFLNKQNGITFGDALSFKGMYDAMNDPMKNTETNRAGDTVNSNFYKNYGKEGIKVLEDSKRMLMANKDQAILDAQSQYATPYGRSGNTQAINQLYQQGLKNQNITNASLNYANQKNGIQSQLANAENQQDQMVMQGEEKATLANQQDRDNFNKQMARDIETKNYGLQNMGMQFNNIKERNTNLNLINSIYPDFKANGMTGEIKRKAVSNVEMNKNLYSAMPKNNVKEVVDNLGIKYIVENNKVYNLQRQELDHNTLQIKNPAETPVVANAVAPVVNNTPTNATPFDVNMLLPKMMQNKTSTYTSPFINK